MHRREWFPEADSSTMASPWRSALVQNIVGGSQKMDFSERPGCLVQTVIQTMAWEKASLAAGG